MKNIGIIRRTPEDSNHMYLLKLDSAVIPDGDDRKVFTVVNSQFHTLGTARVLESENGQSVFELMIPGRENAGLFYAATDKEQVKATSPTWGRSNTDCAGIFCIEIGINCQDVEPESYGFREYHPTMAAHRPAKARHNTRTFRQQFYQHP